MKSVSRKFISSAAKQNYVQRNVLLGCQHNASLFQNKQLGIQKDQHLYSIASSNFDLSVGRSVLPSSIQKRFYTGTHRDIPGLQINNTENYSERIRSRLYSPFVIVPQAEKWVIERFGKYYKTLDSGIHFLVPILDHVAYRHTTKEITFEVTKQTAITKDNVQLNIDGVIYTRIIDPYRASYEIEKPFTAIMNLAQTTMRAEIGKITLDTTFAERQTLNDSIVKGIEKTADGWGVAILRYEIRDIQVPQQIKQAMDLEAESERRKRKKVLDSLAEKEYQENVASGRKTSVELVSEANMTEEMNISKGNAFAIKQKAHAYAEAIERLADAISKPNGEKALAYKLAEQYVEQFGRIAQVGNTIVVPSNMTDVASNVTGATSILGQVLSNPHTGVISKDEALTKLKDMVGFDKLNNDQTQQNANEQQPRRNIKSSTRSPEPPEPQPGTPRQDPQPPRPNV